MLRKQGVYDEPRVHVAVVCASVGCPMLRNEAFVAERLDAQLEDAMRRFLSDRTRNRYDPQDRQARGLEDLRLVRQGFRAGLHTGFTSVKATLAKYADLLADQPEDRAAVRGAEGRGRLPRLRLDAQRREAVTGGGGRYNRPMAALSIIVPALDEAAGIEHALAPLQAMRARGVEVIVVRRRQPRRDQGARRRALPTE